MKMKAKQYVVNSRGVVYELLHFDTNIGMWQANNVSTRLYSQLYPIGFKPLWIQRKDIFILGGELYKVIKVYLERTAGDYWAKLQNDKGERSIIGLDFLELQDDLEFINTR